MHHKTCAAMNGFAISSNQCYQADEMSARSDLPLCRGVNAPLQFLIGNAIQEWTIAVKSLGIVKCLNEGDFI